MTIHWLHMSPALRPNRIVPLLSRGGESRRARSASPIGRSLNKSGGWGGAGQTIDLLTSTTPSAPSKDASRRFLDVAATPPRLRRGVSDLGVRHENYIERCCRNFIR